MAWIRTVRPEEAEGIVKEEYSRLWGTSGAVPVVHEVISIFSPRPDLLQARGGFGHAMTFGGSGLGRYREELISVSISQLLGCKF